MASTAYEKILREALKLEKADQLSLVAELLKMSASVRKKSALEFFGVVKGSGVDAQEQVDRLGAEWKHRDCR